MNIQKVLQDLREKRDHLEEAILALERLDAIGRRGRPRAAVAPAVLRAVEDQDGRQAVVDRGVHQAVEDRGVLRAAVDRVGHRVPAAVDRVGRRAVLQVTVAADRGVLRVTVAADRGVLRPHRKPRSNLIVAV